MVKRPEAVGCQRPAGSMFACIGSHYLQVFSLKLQFRFSGVLFFWRLFDRPTCRLTATIDYYQYQLISWLFSPLIVWSVKCQERTKKCSSKTKVTSHHSCPTVKNTKIKKRRRVRICNQRIFNLNWPLSAFQLRTEQFEVISSWQTPTLILCYLCTGVLLLLGLVLKKKKKITIPVPSHWCHVQ